jgi:hypothetical protein
MAIAAIDHNLMRFEEDIAKLLPKVTTAARPFNLV